MPATRSGAPVASRLICQASPSKTHQRMTFVPFALASANRYRIMS